MAKDDAAIYARVSNDDKGQDPQNQVAVLKDFAAKTGIRIVEVYVDRETGTGKRVRLEFERMVGDAERGRFGTLLIWALDRLSREGTLKTLLLVERLSRAGVRIKSHQEPWLDPGSPMYDLLLPIFAWIARQESQRIGERVRAGLVRARSEGKVIGRPRVRVTPEAAAQTYKSLGSVLLVAKQHQISVSTAKRLLRRAGVLTGDHSSSA